MRGVALAVAALFVLGWRATGLWLAEDPRTLAVALTLLGLLNLACGLYVVRTVRSRAARVFAAQALCQGLHWGGPLALADEQWKLAADLFYVIVAVVLTQCLFVLLACEISGRMAWTRDRRVWWLAAPVGVSVAIAGATWGDVEGARSALLAIYAFSVYGLGLAGLAVIAWSARQTRGGLILVAALAIPAAVGLTAEAAGLESEWLNLLYAGEPLAFAHVIRRAN